MPLLFKLLRAVTVMALLASVSGCKPFVYCNECGVHPDAGLVDAPSIDAGTDTTLDAPSIDVGSDAGPPPIPAPLDGTTLPDRVCSLGGWCWLSPQAPPDASWSDVAVVAMNEAWIVTEEPVDHVTPGGALLRYDGTAWRGLIGVGARVVAGSGSSDVWFLSGDHTITHWNGTTFRPIPIDPALLAGGTGIVRDIASSSATDVWAVGDGGVFLHHDGTMWSAVRAGVGIRDLTSVHVAAANDIWVGGAAGVVRHLSATGWDPVDAPSDFDVDAIWAPADATAAGATSAWIGGASGARYWDVTMATWRTPTGAAAAHIVAIDGNDASDVYMLSTDATDFDAFHTSLVPVADGAPECNRVAVAAFDADRYLRVGGRVSAGTRACSIDLMTSSTPAVDGTSPSSGPFGAVSSVAWLPVEAQLLVYAFDGPRTGDPATMMFTAMPTLIPTGVTSTAIDVEAALSVHDIWIDAHDASDARWHMDASSWTSHVVSPGATDLIFATSATETWVAAGASVFAWVSPDFVARGAALADPVVSLAVADDGTAWAIHGTTLAHFAAGAWTDLGASLPSDCAPLVARGTTAVECLATGGRYRFTVDGSGGVITPATGVPTFAAGEARALIGERAWMFARGAAGEADERILWSELGEAWNPRSSGWAGDGTLRMLADGTTWRVTNGSLLEWRPR